MSFTPSMAICLACGSARRSMRTGASLAELVVVLGVVAALLAVAVPAISRWADRIAVRGAADEVMTVFASARGYAVARGGAAVILDGISGVVLLRVRADTLSRRDLQARLGVRVSSTRPEMSYDGRGLGRGAANLRVVLSRGSQAETIFVSRLGRARR